RELRLNNPTNILNISYRGAVAEECGVVLAAVINSYSKFLDNTYRNVSDETAKLITEARDVLEKRLAKKEDDFKKFRLEHPMLWKGKEGVNVLQHRLFSIEAKKSLLLLRKTEIDASIAAFDRAMKDPHASRGELL